MRVPLPKVFLFDMDGVLYHGERALPGAAEILMFVRDRPHAFITNNPIRTPEALVERFRRLGLPVPEPDRIVTSAEATAQWLAGERPGFCYFAIGAAGLHAALSAVGEADAERADFVVVGEGPGLDFDSLTIAINLIMRGGARLVATNPDKTVDEVRDGRHLILPGCGALVAPLIAATGRRPVIIGKPEPLLYRMAMRRLVASAEDCVMVGDRPDTDIAGAAALGMRTALVRTGRFAPGDAWPADLPRPTWDVNGLEELLAIWRGLN